jgi:hypothetical protein
VLNTNLDPESATKKTLSGSAQQCLGNTSWEGGGGFGTTAVKPHVTAEAQVTVYESVAIPFRMNGL